MLRIARRNPTSPRKRGEVTRSLASIQPRTISLSHPRVGEGRRQPEGGRFARLLDRERRLVGRLPEKAVGGTGIGYFVWNEWNNLSITNVIIAIFMIGLVGMLLDQVLARVTRLVTFPE